MNTRSQIIKEIYEIDERYLDLLYRITRQLPHVSPSHSTEGHIGGAVAKILHEIAAEGGLGISEPEAWQRDIRRDRSLPFRDES